MARVTTERSALLRRAIHGLAVALVVGALVVSMRDARRRGDEAELVDRVRDVHGQLQDAGFSCSGLDITLSANTGMLYAQGDCALDASHSVEIRIYRSQPEVTAAVHALASQSGSFIVGDHWFIELVPSDLDLAYRIAQDLDTRVVGGPQAILVVAS